MKSKWCWQPLLMPMLMSAIVDGGCTGRDTFHASGAFSGLIAQHRPLCADGGGHHGGGSLPVHWPWACWRHGAAIATRALRNMRSGTLRREDQGFFFSSIDHISTPQLITRATTDINTLRDTMRHLW